MYVDESRKLPMIYLKVTLPCIHGDESAMFEKMLEETKSAPRARG